MVYYLKLYNKVKVKLCYRTTEADKEREEIMYVGVKRH